MEDDRVYKPDLTLAPAELLRRCAEEYGTPVLVYSGRVLRERQAMLARRSVGIPAISSSFRFPLQMSWGFCA